MHERIYRFLFNDEDAQICRDIPAEACNDQPRNFLLNIIALALTKTGDQFMDPKITLSWLLTTLGSPTFYLSLLVPIHNTFSLLPQMLVAAAIRRVPIRKWLWSAGSVGQAFALFYMGYVALNLEGGEAGLAIMAALLVFSLSRGVCSVTQKDVLGKTVAKTRRGRVSGYTETVSGVLTLLLACWLMYTGERTLDVVAGILMVAAVLWVLAAIVFAQMREVPGATGGGGNALTEAVKQLSLLRSNHEFRKFVITRSSLLGSALVAPYLVALIQRNAGNELSVLGGLLFAGSLASFVSGSTWGKLADRSSARCMTIAGVLAGSSGLLALLLVAIGVTGLLPLATCLFLLYLAHAGVRVGRKTHLIDMASAEDRSAMVAVSNSLIGLMLLVFAGMGALVSQWHLNAGLVFFSLLAMCGAILARNLREVQALQEESDDEVSGEPAA